MPDPASHSVEAEAREWYEANHTGWTWSHWNNLRESERAAIVKMYTAARNAGLDAAAEELMRAAQFDRSTWRVGRQLLNDGRDWERFLADSIRALKGDT